MQYVAYDGDSGYYLRRVSKKKPNDYSFVRSIELATKWDKKRTVANIINALGKGYAQYSFEAKSTVDLASAELSDFDVSEELGYDIMEKIGEIKKYVMQAEARREQLQMEMSEIDLKIVDIEHAAEFYDLNAAQGYKLYKMLHNARIKRRRIKNEMEKLSHFLNTRLNTDDLLHLQSSINGMKNRQYTPRVNNELFEV